MKDLKNIRRWYIVLNDNNREFLLDWYKINRVLNAYILTKIQIIDDNGWGQSMDIPRYYKYHDYTELTLDEFMIINDIDVKRDYSYLLKLLKNIK